MELTGTPEWLRRRPLLLTALLVFSNRLRTSRFGHTTLLLAAAAFILLVVGIPVIIRGSPFGEMIAVLNRFDSSPENLLLSALVATVCAALFTSSRLRIVRERLRRSWLAGTVHVNALTCTQRVAVALWPTATILVLTFIVAAGFHFGAQMAGSFPFAAALTAGALSGTLIGLFTASTRADTRQRRSRLASRRPNASPLSTSSIIDSRALAHWPIREAKAMCAPANSRLLLLVALVTLPAGMSGWSVFAVLAAWVLCGWLITLLFALHNSVRDARSWLASTQVTCGQLIEQPVTRVATHHLAGLGVIASLFLIPGSGPMEVLYSVMSWVSLATVFAATSLRRAWHGLPGRWMATVGTFLALLCEQTLTGTAAVIAVIAIGTLWKERSALART